MVIGNDRTTAVHGGFHEEIARMAAGFEGPIAVAVLQVSHLRELPKQRFVVLADRYDMPIRTGLRLDIAPENAILRQARLGRYDLDVIGVGRPRARRSISARSRPQFWRSRSTRSCSCRAGPAGFHKDAQVSVTE
jgi:hypothetical protein